MNLRLEGKRAAVAAASAGLGFAVAQALAAEGARVCICGRNRRAIEAAAREIDGVPIVADLATGADGGSFVERAISAMGSIDILVINGGGPNATNFESADLQAYEDALQSNLLSGVAMCQAAVPEMRRNGWGRILAITSMTARQPRSGNIMTGTTRAGLTAVLKALSIDLAPHAITVNTLQPGPHETARLSSLYSDDAKAKLINDIPARMLGRPEDFGQVAAFLCSDQARFITGSSLLVDGGMYPGLY